MRQSSSRRCRPNAVAKEFLIDAPRGLSSLMLHCDQNGTAGKAMYAQRPCFAFGKKQCEDALFTSRTKHLRISGDRTLPGPLCKSRPIRINDDRQNNDASGDHLPHKVADTHED